MHRRYTIGGCLILILLLSPFIYSQQKTVAKNQELLSIDVVDRPFSEIIDGIRDRTGANIVYDPEIAEIDVTIKLTQLPWRKILEVISKEYNCLVEDIDLVIKVSKPPTVTMEFDGADIRDIINQIATLANKNIIISDEVRGPVTLRLQNVPWKDALDSIIKNGGYVLVTEAEGRILRVVPKEAIQEDTETRIFKLRYIRPKSPFVATMTNRFLATNQQQQVRAQTQGELEVSSFSLLNALAGAATAKGRVTYDELTNTLIVTDIRTKLDEMSSIVKKLDIEPKQIFIDIKFVRTTNTDVFDFGIGLGNNGIQVTQTFGSMATRLPFSIGRDGFEDYIAAVPNDQLQGLGAFREDRGFPNDQNVIDAVQQPVQFGTLDFTQTNFVLRLLKTDTKTKIIQSPKIITLDHHEATIFVGDTISFAKTEIVENDNGNQSVQLVEAENSPAQDGFQILLLPHVIPDTNKVQITVIPSNDLLSGAEAVPRGFNRFASGGAEILLPQITSQVIVTHMILESGQTAVVGGLLTINQSETMTKVPFLGDIPLLGYLFKSKNVQKIKQDLYIFITPRIVQSAEDTQSNLSGSLTNYRSKEAKKNSVIWQGDDE